MNSTSQDSGTSPQSSNIYIYTALTVLSIAVIYILYKQTTSNQASDNAIKAAAAAAATSATQNAGYETQSDLTATLNGLIKSTGNNTVTVPATGGLYYTLPAYGFFTSTVNNSNSIWWTPVAGAVQNLTVSSSDNSKIIISVPGVYEITMSGNVDSYNKTDLWMNFRKNGDYYPAQKALIGYTNVWWNSNGTYIPITANVMCRFVANDYFNITTSNVGGNTDVQTTLSVKWISQ
jgi:uncharacterized protein (UPF0333 family)